jgi:23S rRNA (adenine1618-N6)-methyltransferase
MGFIFKDTFKNTNEILNLYFYTFKNIFLAKFNQNQSEKPQLHPRNRFNTRYDFETLIIACPELAPFVFINKYDSQTIDFSEPEAVKLLNKALLTQHYGLSFWDIPAGYLCPPIPGRADYIHYIADLLANNINGQILKGKHIKCLDIGVGANCIYPIIGTLEYGWSFVGSDIDQKALETAQTIAKFNPQLKNNLEFRLQTEKNQLFKGIIEPNEKFDVTICNPPFHASETEANTASLRKVQNLSGQKIQKPLLNFGGKNSELWYEGGEAKFLKNMITESAEFSKSCLWFTSLVSKKENLPSLYNNLKYYKATEVKTIQMAQGQKVSRFVAWTFLNKKERDTWLALRNLE